MKYIHIPKRFELYANLHTDSTQADALEGYEMQENEDVRVEQYHRIEN